MFIHTVLFEIKPKDVSTYRKDSRMWAKYAKKVKGFIACFIMRRNGYKNQYASVYEWKDRKAYMSFTNKFHDWLAEKSSSRVKLLGRYNLEAIDKVRK